MVVSQSYSTLITSAYLITYLENIQNENFWSLFCQLMELNHVWTIYH